MTMEKAFKPKGALARLLEDDDEDKEKKREMKKPGPIGKLFDKITDVRPRFHHNRVEGWHMGLGYDKKFKKRYIAKTEGGWNAGLEEWWYGGSFAFSFGKNNRGKITAHAATGVISMYGTGLYPLWLSSIQTLSGIRDYYDYYRNDSAGIDFDYRIPKIDIHSRLGFSFEHHAPLVKTSDEGIFGKSGAQRPNPRIATGQLRSITLRLRRGDIYEASTVAMAGVKGIELSVEHSSPSMFDSDYLFTRWKIDAAWRMETMWKRRLFPATLDLRLTGGASTGRLPLQRFGALDGSLAVLTPFGSFRSLRNRPLVGEQWCGMFAEHNFRTVPFELIGLTWFADRNVTIILHGAAGRTWISSSTLDRLGFNPPYSDDLVSEIGFSVNTIYSLFRLDVTKRLDRRGTTVGAWLSRYI